MELSSEAPGVNSNWPSDISFCLNDESIGIWTSPGDFGDVRGIFTPDWWMKYMEKWLQERFSDFPITFIDAKEPFGYL